MATKTVLIPVLAAVLLLGVIMLIQERLIFFPEKLDRDQRLSFPFDFEEYFTIAEDSHSLHSLHFKSPNPRGLLFYLHGNAGSLRDWGFVAGDFLKHDYDVFITDYRGYGKSSGVINSEKQLYSDAQVVYEQAKKLFKEDKIVLYGRSLGTGIAGFLATQNNPQALLLETPYFSFSDVAKHHYPFVPQMLLKYKFPLSEFVSAAKVPTFLFHGSDDEIIPFSQSEKLKKHHPQLQLFRIEGGRHNNLSEFESYHQAVQWVLEKLRSSG